MNFTYAPLMPDPIEAARRAVAFNPKDPQARANLANALYSAGRFAEAADAFAEASKLAPQDPMLRGNLGISLAKSGRAAEAAPILHEVAQHPQASHVPEVFYNLGNCLRLLFRLEEAVAAYTRAIDLRPDYADGHWNRGLVLLLDGKFPDGWDEFEWRHWLPGRKPLPLIGPAWTGDVSRLPGKILLLAAEQGFGDTMQFVRYVPQLADAGATVILVCQKELQTLLRGTKGLSKILAPGDAIPRFDMHAALMSLPRLMKTDLSNIPAATPYIFPDESKRTAWRDRLAALGPTRKVGIAWAGRPTHQNDANRSMKLADFAPLAAVPGITWLSLQKGPAAEQIKSSGRALPLHDWTPELNDFADTAALVAELDLILTVDTAMSHLAGGLGKPVWTLLPTVPDWRWLLARDDSPWYPTMRLFRQPTPGDWKSVMEMVGRALA